MFFYKFKEIWHSSTHYYQHQKKHLIFLIVLVALASLVSAILGEFKHEVRQFEKSYDNQQAEQISLMV